MPIEAVEARETTLKRVDSQEQAISLHSDPKVLKLFLMKHDSYQCHSMTWGSAKGLDQYHDVCVVMNDTTWRQYQAGDLRNAKPIIKNKLYVACSRPHRNLYLAPEILFSRFKS